MSSIKSNNQLYELLTNMLNELKCSHFSIIPPTAYYSECEGDLYNDTIGISVRLLEGHLTITRVEEGSPAAGAGLKPGFIVTQIGDKSMAAIRAKMAARKKREPEFRSLVAHAAAKALSGSVGSKVTISYLDEKNSPRKVAIKRAEPKGEPVHFDDFPLCYVVFESKRLPADIGYMRFNNFVPELTEKIRNVASLFHDSPGIIIDLRGNTGGDNQMAANTVGLFYKDQVLLGKHLFRWGEMKVWSYPVDKPYAGKVVILIDEVSASASEALAICMQENGRAVIIGQPSLGALVGCAIERLPTGARLQYAISAYHTAKGTVVEGRGVIPDIIVEPTRKELLEGRDPVLEKAIAEIANR
jgi:C-terminal peptidase prc